MNYNTTKGELDMKNKNIAKAIKQRRKELRLSQSDLGTMIGRNSGYIDLVETGVTKVNSFYLKKFADALGKDEEYFRKYKNKAS
jgi:transcriptional regulator with XRE-family HTH domain